MNELGAVRWTAVWDEADGVLVRYSAYVTLAVRLWWAEEKR